MAFVTNHAKKLFRKKYSEIKKIFRKSWQSNN